MFIYKYLVAKVIIVGNKNGTTKEYKFQINKTLTTGSEIFSILNPI